MLEHQPTSLLWVQARPSPSLSGADLHLWRLHLSHGDSGTDAEDSALLSPRQTERMHRFRQPLHRRRYLRTQAACRRILAGYVGRAPETLAFRFGPAGKPALDLGDAAPELPVPEFNLTTTGDLALLAVSATHPVGIDCELERDRLDLIGIAERMFDADAVASLAERTGNARRRLFHLHWTALEARLKADGRGLAGHRTPDPPGLVVVHALAGAIDGQVAVCAVARRNLPPPEQWLALEFRGQSM